MRDIQYREAVLYALGVKDKDAEQEAMIDDYCRACRIARKDVDCATCRTEEIKPIEDKTWRIQKEK